MHNEHALMQVGQKAVFIRDGRCMILEGSNRENVWDLPGGRIHVQEDQRDAFLRELKEEIGLHEVEVLGVIDYEVWLPANGHVPICLIASLVASEQTDFTVSSEHKNFKWVTEEELDAYSFYSDAMPRMIKKGFQYVRQLQHET